ncbi:hypothetical protein [Paeniglutamicibacter sp. NPDC091659]|uniref:hypothetical protein n=1 Tax=Paeniglutamicibacter sp. NPDC091659 TaxID=3364389 RepID=UPI0037FF0A89
MSSEDPIEEAHGISVMLSSSAMRGGEVLLQQLRERKMDADRKLQEQTRELQQRFEQESKAAHVVLSRASKSEDWMKTAERTDIANAWRMAQEWKEADPERFAPIADKLTTNFDHMFSTKIAHDGQDPMTRLAAAEDMVDHVDSFRAQAQLEEEAAVEHRATADAELTNVAEGIELPDVGFAAAGEEISVATAHEESADVATSKMNAVEVDAANKLKLGYDSVEARADRDARMKAAGVDPESLKAKSIADTMNPNHPVDTLRRSGGKKVKPQNKSSQRSTPRTKNTELSR